MVKVIDTTPQPKKYRRIRGKARKRVNVSFSRQEYDDLKRVAIQKGYASVSAYIAEKVLRLVQNYSQAA